MSKKAKKAKKALSIHVSYPASVGTPVFLNGKQCGIVESTHEEGSTITLHDSQVAIELMHGTTGLSIGCAGKLEEDP